MNALIINLIEQLVTDLVYQLTTNRSIIFYIVNCQIWENFEVINAVLALRPNRNSLSYTEVTYNSVRSRHRLSMIVYILAEVHGQLLQSGSCMLRELYYKDTIFSRNQCNVYRAVNDVCQILQTSPWNLGIYASGKGLVAGALRVFLQNGDVIDCRGHNGAAILPQNLNKIHHLETNASFVLIVEKDTVFERLLSRNILSLMGVELILITGKGYPDVCTRFFVHRLNTECKLPVYILVDADPYGIEIMLLYRYGSRTLANGNTILACPNLFWVGLHPSEIDAMPVSTSALNMQDHKKIVQLLKRNYINEGVRNELQILQHRNQKAEIEGFAHNTMDFLINDYIPNKIIRNLLI